MRWGYSRPLGDLGVMEVVRPHQHGVHVLRLLSAGPKQCLRGQVQASGRAKEGKASLLSPGLLHLSICAFF